MPGPSQSLSPSGSLLLPVQAAMWGTLEGTPGLLALVTGIFDEVPTGQAFPFLVLDTAVEIADNTQDHLGRDIITTLDVWSRGQGFAEALTIADLTIKALDNVILQLSTGTSWRCQFDDLHTMRDSDGYTRHARLTFRVGVQT